MAGLLRNLHIGDIVTIWRKVAAALYTWELYMIRITVFSYSAMGHMLYMLFALFSYVYGLWR